MAKPDKIHVIITDDSSAFIEVLSSIFSENPYFEIIDKCSNGLELINNIQLHKAQLLLIDIEMPKMNGLEAAKRINFQYPNLPMIALTMHQDKFYLTDIVKVGFRAFIYKPEVPQKIFEVIDDVFKNKFVFPDNLKIN